MEIFSLIVILVTYASAIVAVPIAVTQSSHLILGIIAFLAVIMFPFLVEFFTHPKRGWFIWNILVITSCIFAYSGWSIIIFALWAFFAWQWRNLNGPRLFTVAEFMKMFSWRRVA